jgi:ligand-binding sensor domain-containing protein
MTKHYSINICYTLLLTFLFASCNGQVKKESSHQGTTISTATSKLIKAQTSNEADNVHAIMQDKEGFIWVATTADGVYKHDGKTFTNFTTNDGLNSNCVLALLQDKTGNIWLGTDKGLNRFDGRKFSQIPAKTSTEFYNPKPNTEFSVNSILQDKTGLFWIATETGIFNYDGKNVTPFIDKQNIINPNKFNPQAVTNAMQDKKCNIWFTTRGEGIYRFDGSEILNFQPDGLGWFFKIFEDDKGNILVGNRVGDGIYKFDGNNFVHHWQSLGLKNYVISSMVQDKKGNIWFGTEADDASTREINGGLWCYNGSTLKNFTSKDGLDDVRVFTVFEDRSGNIWIGGRNTTLSKYDGKTFISCSR